MLRSCLHSIQTICRARLSVVQARVIGSSVFDVEPCRTLDYVQSVQLRTRQFYFHSASRHTPAQNNPKGPESYLEAAGASAITFVEPSSNEDPAVTPLVGDGVAARNRSAGHEAIVIEYQVTRSR